MFTFRNLFELPWNARMLLSAYSLWSGALGNGMLEPGMQVMTKPFAMEALACKITAMIEA